MNAASISARKPFAPIRSIAAARVAGRLRILPFNTNPGSATLRADAIVARRAGPRDPTGGAAPVIPERGVQA